MSADAPSAVQTTDAEVWRPTALDRLDLALLRTAKRRRSRFDGTVEFYEDFFAERDIERYLEDIRMIWRFRRVKHTFERVCPDGTGRVLDVGCGLAVSRGYIPSSASYVGIDPSARTLRLARRIHGEGVELHQGCFPSLPAPDGIADLAICLEVLEHVSDDGAALRDLARVVRPGGHLLVSVPRAYYWPEYRALIGHYRHYTAAKLDRLLAANGFEVVTRYSQLVTVWRLYHYLYVAARAIEVPVRAIRPRWSLYRSTVFRWLSARTLRYAETRATRAEPQSTAVLCRKGVAA